MEFRVLGPLEVEDSSGRRIQLPAGRERALLVALLLRRGEVVSVDSLIDALWGERAPSTAAKAVQGYVSHLRRLLESDAGALVTRSPGYVLQAEDAQLDSARFERLAADGRRALDEDDPQAALAVLDSALGLWRGPALAEFAFDDFAQTEIQRLTERRLEASEDRVDAVLQLGRHAGLVSELEAFVAAHPRRERSRGQLMLALYRAGRPADALQTYRDGASLARELGLDPAPELRQLERAILEQDPALAAPARVPTADGRAADLPASAPSVGESAGGARRSRRGRALVAALIAGVLALVLVAVLALDPLEDGGASVAVVPPAVAVIDPETNRVVATLETGSRPVTVAAGEGAVWVGDASDSTVARIDPETREIVKRIGIGAPAVDIAVGAGHVWVATGGFGEVVRIDPGLNDVVDRISLSEPGDPIVPAVSAIAAGPEGVWIGAFDGLARIDPRSGDIVERVDLGRTPAQAVEVGGGAVWSTIISSRAKRVEASSGIETAEFYQGTSLYPVAVDRTSVWVGGGFPNGQAWELDPVTAISQGSTGFPAFVSALALTPEVVWATVEDEQTVFRVDRATREIVARIPVTGWAGELAVESGLVWVAVLAPEDEEGG